MSIEMSHFSLKVNAKYHQWGIGAFYGFLDQGLFSTTNFITSILLARWLPEEEYGAFAVAFSFYLLISTVPSALITEPMLVFGPTQHEAHLPEYIGEQILIHFQLVLILSLLLLFGAVFTVSKVQSALVGVALAMPFTLIFWLFRRACYIKMQTNVAFTISLLYSIIVLLGLLLLRNITILDSLTVFLLMGVSSLIASVLAVSRLRIRLKWSNKLQSVFNINKLFFENWEFGKWILAASIADGIIYSIYPPIISVFVGLREAAALRSMQNLLLPLQQIHATITLMLIPWLSRKASQFGNANVYKDLLKVGGIYIFSMFLYTIPLIIFAKPIVSLIYTNIFYENYSWLLPLLSISYVFTSIGLAFVVALRSIKLSKPLLWSKFCAAFVVLTIGIMLIYKWELPGVVLSIYLSTVAECLILSIVCVNVFKGYVRKNKV